jgi:hypothetical protein
MITRSWCFLNGHGVNFWHLNRQMLHRECGPAVEYDDGRKEWWLFGKQYTEEEFNRALKLKAFGKMDIEILGLVLREWKYSYCNIEWSRSDINGANVRLWLIIDQFSHMKWKLGFSSEFWPIQEIYNGQDIFNTSEEAKEYIDNWLIRINKLKAFW